MSEPTEYQVIRHRGRPAYVLVPYRDFERIRPLLEAARASRNIPQEVVERHVLDGVPLVRAWREHLGLSQEELAARAGMRPSALARIERPSSRPRRTTLARLARAMGLRPEQLALPR
ncbi:MAG TPA: helix-turn-helix domain-containing protein [Chromatiales bacterium]|nr:helix-turn-helix domain-containing protein [Chromatiales bacterium]